MKKYIRTKHSVHEWKKLYPTSRLYYKDYPEEIIKQSNSIEKLCDAFVMFRDGKPYALVENNENNLKMVRGGAWGDLRGAIWTDKGLIYVAKRNDKGEFELL